MASIIRPAWRVAARLSPTPRSNFSPRLRTSFARSYSAPSTQSPPPLLGRIRGDLKTAMKAKDQRRLTVIRAFIATYNEVVRKDVPCDTDAHLVAMLRKAILAAQDAIEEFSAAGRQDLVDLEEESIRILMGYIETSGVPMLDDQAVEAAFESVVASMKAEGGKEPNVGKVMAKLKSTGSPLEGKDYNPRTITRLAQSYGSPKK